jgi:hypothetical protein
MVEVGGRCCCCEIEGLVVSFRWMVDANEGSELHNTVLQGMITVKRALEARYIHKYRPFTHLIPYKSTVR